MGRPRLSDRPDYRSLGVRLTEEERTRLEAASSDDGFPSLTAWALWCMEERAKIVAATAPLDRGVPLFAVPRGNSTAKPRSVPSSMPTEGNAL